MPSFIDVGPAVLELYGFENVDAATDGRTDGQLTGFISHLRRNDYKCDKKTLTAHRRDVTVRMLNMYLF